MRVEKNIKISKHLLEQRTINCKEGNKNSPLLFLIIMANNPLENNFFSQVIDLLQSARNEVVRSVNHTMVFTYFEIGRMIVEKEQNGKNKAEYGESLLKNLSKTLTREFGKGFSQTNLKQMRRFYLIYSKGQTLSDHSQNLSKKYAFGRPYF